MNQPTIEEMRAALEATKLPPKEHFARMVADGLIEPEGQLTKLYGGQAEPEPWAKRPLLEPNLFGRGCPTLSVPLLHVHWPLTCPKPRS